MTVTLDLDPAELGWLLMAVRDRRKHDDKGVVNLERRFGTDTDPTNGAYVRQRLGLQVAPKLRRAAKEAGVQVPGEGA